jgi:drug/metabolite transporter (DMT)-like permease
VHTENLKGAFGASSAAVAAMLVACALFVVGDSCIKLVGHDLALGQIILMRGLISAPFVVLMAARAGVLGHIGRVAANPRIQVRTVLEVGSTILFLAGLIRMTYADAITIQQFIPLAVMAGAALFLGEHIGWRRWMAALVGLVGVLIVVQPGAGTFNWPALLIVGNILCVAGRDLVTRRLKESFPSVLIVLMSVVSVGLSGLLLLPFETWRVPTGWETFLITIAAISSIGGFYWVTEALRSGEVGVVIPFRYSLIPYGVLSGLLLFGEWPRQHTLIGIAVVMGAGLYAIHRERVRAREAAAG